MVAPQGSIWTATKHLRIRNQEGAEGRRARLISLVIANGDVAHSTQVYILAGAILHSDVQYPVLRNVDRLATTIAAVSAVVVVIGVVVVIIIVTTADG